MTSRNGICRLAGTPRARASRSAARPASATAMSCCIPASSGVLRPYRTDRPGTCWRTSPSHTPGRRRTAAGPATGLPPATRRPPRRPAAAHTGCARAAWRGHTTGRPPHLPAPGHGYTLNPRLAWPALRPPRQGAAGASRDHDRADMTSICCPVTMTSWAPGGRSACTASRSTRSSFTSCGNTPIAPMPPATATHGNEPPAMRVRVRHEMWARSQPEASQPHIKDRLPPCVPWM